MNKEQPFFEANQESEQEPSDNKQPAQEHLLLPSSQEGALPGPMYAYWLRRWSFRRDFVLPLVCGVLLTFLTFGVVIGAGGSRSSLPRTSAPPSPTIPATATMPGVVISSHSRTPLARPGETPTAAASTTATAIVTTAGSTPTTSVPITSSPASIYYGVHVALDSLSYVTAFEADAHKAVSIVMWYQQWGLTNGWQNFQTGWMNAVRAHGSIPLVTWDPGNPYISSPVQPIYALQNIINGNFDSYITRWALASKAWGHPYFLRFAHEMNGYWNPWSELVNGNQPGQFVLAWRHVHDIFTRLGVTNVTWVWSPNIDFSNSTPLAELYPGDAYVNWVGMSGYNWGNIGGHSWQSFSSVFSQTYHDLLSITSLPIMITETASTEQDGNKAAWITDAYVTQLPNYFPRIRAVVWFNEPKETDWQIESSISAQNAFASAIQSRAYASNNYAGLSALPISPL